MDCGRMRPTKMTLRNMVVIIHLIDRLQRTSSIFRHPSYNQLKPVKTRFPVKSARENIRLIAHWERAFYKLTTVQQLVFEWITGSNQVNLLLSRVWLLVWLNHYWNSESLNTSLKTAISFHLILYYISFNFWYDSQRGQKTNCHLYKCYRRVKLHFRGRDFKRNFVRACLSTFSKNNLLKITFCNIEEKNIKTTLLLTALNPEILDFLTSEGYPVSYKRNFDNTSTYGIPEGRSMNIFFHDFEVEYTPYCK